MITMKEPLVSVIIPSFNESAPVIRRAIDSVIEQTYKNWELLIVDDSTSKETKEAINEYENVENISVYRFPNRLGVSAARNYGMEQAMGEYIAFLDGDDVATPDRLELQVRYFMENPETSVLGGGMYIIDEDENITSVRKYPTRGFRLKLWSAFRNPLAQPTVMIHRRVVDGHFRYDVALRRSEDLDLWLQIRDASLVIRNLPNCILKYRVCENLGYRRKKDNWKANLQVRMRHFSWKSPILSLISVSVAFIFTLVPSVIVRFAYNLENGRR